jgi:hypothetical protein
MLGCADDSSCVAEIGGALGAGYLLVGTYGKLGALFRIDMKLVETKHGRVLERFGYSVEGREEELASTVQLGVRTLLAAIPGAPPAEKVAAQATLTAAPGAPGPVAPTPPASRRRMWGWVAGGIGIAALAGGTIVGLQARSALDAEKKAAVAGNYADFTRNRSDVKSKSRVADALFAGGALGLGAGLYLYLTGKPAPVAVAALPLPGGVVAAVEGRF